MLSEASHPPERSLPKWVLVVDDDARVRRSTGLLLEKLGFASAEVPDVSAAILYLDRMPEAIHIVLTDLNLPGLSGADLANLLERTRADLPVVVCTGNFAALRRELLHFHGEILLKPFSAAELGESLARALRRTTRAI